MEWQPDAWSAISVSGCYMGIVRRDDGFNWWITDNGGKAGVMVLGGGLEPTLEQAKATAEAAAANHCGKKLKQRKK